jgi:hypothetical protein
MDNAIELFVLLVGLGLNMKILNKFCVDLGFYLAYYMF